MAKGKAKSKGRASPKRKTDTAMRSQDAIALLKADHREVEEFFEQFEKARDDGKKQELATQICTALKMHTTIEEEIFYPAFLEATEDMDLHHEAEIEHDGAKQLIAKIEASSPDDDYFDSMVSVLSEMIKHHVKEEEQTGGMFAEARKSEMDLDALGERLAQRKAELEQSGMAEMAQGRGKRGMSERAPTGRQR
ncbi:MAG TPA: hemerythrin domain-containing protein [Steroidobacteraceae bacterium]|nr:hemerythrin domain-containing protein [Steroidobacteraceae bacterium]